MGSAVIGLTFVYYLLTVSASASMGGRHAGDTCIQLFAVEPPQTTSAIIPSIPARGFTMCGEENTKPVNVDPRWCVWGPRIHWIEEQG